MPPPLSDTSSWICAGCSRRVPSRVTECRCGAKRPSIGDPSPVAESSERPKARPLLLVGLGLVLGAALAIPALSRWLPQAGPAPVPQAPVNGTPAVAIAPAASVEPPPPPPAAPEPESASAVPLEDIVAKVVPAVASIQAGQARGTGFFIRHDLLVTNAHVVEGQSSVRLQVGDASYTARVATISRGSDLAILEVYNPNPRQATLQLGSAMSARVGQEVIAVGSALGVLSNTVTRGIVSALRQVGEVTLLQTDAAINPGNSGGPLVDRNGHVIGVNSMAVARHAGTGVAFAVAIDHAARLVADTQGRALDSVQRNPGTPPARRVSDAQTPLGGLEQVFGAPSESDSVRAQGEQAYERVLEWAARNAEQIDGYWSRYARTCVATASRDGDRPWFGVMDPDGVTINPNSAYDCAGWLQTLRSNAGPIKARIEQANEAARRDGVFPGVLRDLRRKYRMSWPGWN